MLLCESRFQQSDGLHAPYSSGLKMTSRKSSYQYKPKQEFHCCKAWNATSLHCSGTLCTNHIDLGDHILLSNQDSRDTHLHHLHHTTLSQLKVCYSHSIIQSMAQLKLGKTSLSKMMIFSTCYSVILEGYMIMGDYLIRSSNCFFCK